MYPRTIHPIDQYAGERLYEQRKELELTQDALAKMLGRPVTFQQIQKYESGRNRLSASMLWEFSQALNLPPEYFFPPFNNESTCCTNLQETKLLELFRLLPADKQNTLLSFLQPEGE